MILDQERKRATFSATAMTNMLYGGPEVPHTPHPTCHLSHLRVGS